MFLLCTYSPLSDQPHLVHVTRPISLQGYSFQLFPGVRGFSVLNFSQGTRLRSAPNFLPVELNSHSRLVFLFSRRDKFEHLYVNCSVLPFPPGDFILHQAPFKDPSGSATHPPHSDSFSFTDSYLVIHPSSQILHFFRNQRVFNTMVSRWVGTSPPPPSL